MDRILYILFFILQFFVCQGQFKLTKPIRFSGHDDLFENHSYEEVLVYCLNYPENSYNIESFFINDTISIHYGYYRMSSKYPDMYFYCSKYNKPYEYIGKSELFMLGKKDIINATFYGNTLICEDKKNEIKVYRLIKKK